MVRFTMVVRLPAGVSGDVLMGTQGLVVDFYRATRLDEPLRCTVGFYM